MRYFDTYVSNTTGAGGSQYLFNAAEEKSSRIYYKVFAGGTFSYSLLFTNLVDSTFADGSESHVNLVGGEWEILSASIGIVPTCSATSAPDPSDILNLTFAGKSTKTVMPGEYFTTDPLTISAQKGDYLCLEMVCRGEGIPCHYESVLPAFEKKNNDWVRNTLVPFPSHIGCDRPIAARIGYIGDSITQGCGTEVNSYTNWCAILAEMLGEDCSHWNLGLGYARASDAATDGTWLNKAKQVDGIVVCFGVNDILREHTAEQIKNNLAVIVSKLHASGTKVLLQTVPPFNYTEPYTTVWNDVNTYIRNVLSKEADAFFDCVPTLSAFPVEHPEVSKYGPHPNADGGKVWAEDLYPIMKKFIGTLTAK